MQGNENGSWQTFWSGNRSLPGNSLCYYGVPGRQTRVVVNGTYVSNLLTS